MKAVLYTDGGARGNPGPAAIGVVLTSEDGALVTRFGKCVGTKTNNEAEYLAFIAGLTSALEHQVTHLKCFLDSQLVVEQINGRYKVKNDRIKLLFGEVTPLLAKFESVKVTHVERAKNKEADSLVNEALDNK